MIFNAAFFVVTYNTLLGVASIPRPLRYGGARGRPLADADGGAAAGLGYILFLARDFYRTEVTLLGMIVIGALWLLIDRLVLAPMERATVERWGGLKSWTSRSSPGRDGV